MMPNFPLVRLDSSSTDLPRKLLLLRYEPEIVKAWRLACHAFGVAADSGLIPFDQDPDEIELSIDGRMQLELGRAERDRKSL